MIFMMTKLTPLEKRIKGIEKEMKKALPFSKQFLEGQLSILRELLQEEK